MVSTSCIVICRGRYCCSRGVMERSSSAVECRTRNRVSSGSNTPFATVSKFGHFRSLHDAPVHTAA